MRDNGASDTSDVSSEEGDSGLLQTVVRGLWLAEVGVDVVDGGLKGCELYHGVRNLTGPERVETLVETTRS